MESVALSQRNVPARIWKTLVASVQRNRTIIKAVSLTFFGIVIVSILLTVFAFYASPGLSEFFKSLIKNESSYIAIPPPYTESLYFYIFLNNVSHFWNPIRMLVWVPVLGAPVMGLEILLNGVLIGSVATVVGVSKGVAYPILGLVPHGIIEIPAFILEFTSIIRWQVTTVQSISAKAMGEKVNVPKLKEGIKDTVILAVTSVILFAIAAAVETYITPRLLGL
jgi:stage II sporulation protein M